MIKIIIITLIALIISTTLYSQFKIETIELDEVVLKAKVKLPDLYIHEINGIDSIVKKGTRIIPKIAIGNKGNILAIKDKWSWFFYIEKKLVCFNRVAPFDLKSGKVIFFPSGYNKKYGSFVFKKTGIYNYKLIIETKRKFKEFDKKNNIIKGTIKVIDN